MPTIDPIASAIEALATQLTTALSSNVSSVLRGWPESNKDLDLSGKPVIAITQAGPEEREAVAPRVVDSATAAGVTTYTYKVATLQARLQLDVWAAYRAKLDEIGPLLRAAFTNALPRAGLWLTQGSYYSRPLIFTLEGGAYDHDGDTAAQGEWRRTYEVTVETDEVATTTHAKLTELDVTLTTTDPEGNGTAETVVVFDA